MEERRKHPLHPHIEVRRDGVMFNVRLNRECKYYQTDNQAYLVFKPKDAKQIYYAAAHLVYEAFNGLLSEDQRVYFVNGNFNDRSLANLTAMTPTERKNQIAEDLETRLGGRRHPALSDYVGFPDGKIYSLAKERYLEGYKKTTGYLRYGKLEGHKLVFECFNGLVDGKQFHIDHINNVHDDNRLENLQKLSLREHSRKTWTVDNPSAARKGGLTQSKPLIRLKKNAKGDVTEQKFFDNVQQAVSETMRQFPEIKFMTSDSLTPRTNTNETYKGFFWRFQEPVDLPDEVWKAVPLPNVSLRVSSAGRVEFKNKRRTFGYENSGGYRLVEHKNKPYPVHFLVCATFHPHPTTLDDKTITPDHINHKVDDNRADNLRWASKREQVLNRECMKVIIAFDRFKNEEVGLYKTINDARTAFGVGQQTVIRSLNGTTKTCRALPNIRFVWALKNLL